MDGGYGLLPRSDLVALDEYRADNPGEATADPAIKIGEDDEETQPANPLSCGLLFRQAWNTTAQPSGRDASSVWLAPRTELGRGWVIG